MIVLSYTLKNETRFHFTLQPQVEVGHYSFMPYYKHLIPHRDISTYVFEYVIPLSTAAFDHPVP